MSGNSDRDSQIVTYLLGELSAEENAAFENALISDHELRAEVERTRPLVATLTDLPDDAWDPPEAPRLALPVAELPGEVRPRTFGWLRPRVALAAAGVALAAVATAAIVLVGGSGEDRPPEPGSSFALEPFGAADPQASGSLIEAADGSTASLTVSGLAPSDSGFYEVWLLGERGLVSLGSFRVGPDGDARVDLTLPVDPSDYESFDVSLEPDDGNPDHSGDSVLRGPSIS